MWILERILRNAIKLDENKAFMNCIKDKKVKDFILDLNRKDQLFIKGVDVDGNIVGVYSATTQFLNEGKIFSYEELSKSKIQGEPYLLFDTGEYYGSFKIVLVKDGFYIVSNNLKLDGDLLDDGGYDSLLGLTDENKEKLAQYILPIYTKEARKQLFK